jgi:hypothetical protein
MTGVFSVRLLYLSTLIHAKTLCKFTGISRTTLHYQSVRAGWIIPVRGFAAKVSRVIGSDRIKTHPQSKMPSYVI